MQSDLAIREATAAGRAAALADLHARLRSLMPLCALAGSRGGAILAQFTTQLVVGALAGAHGLGILQLFTSWTCIAGEVLALGLPPRAMRQTAVAYAEQQRTAITQILLQARRKIWRAWLLILLFAMPAFAGITRGQPPQDWSQYHWLLLGCSISAPLFALLRLYAESLKATGAALSAVTLENLTSPVVMLLTCAACWLAALPLVAATLVITFGFSVAITALALRAAMRQQLAQLPAVQRNKHGEETTTAHPRGDLPYLWGSSVLSIAFLHLPFLVMPAYVETAEIGVFAIAHKLVNVITTVLLLLAAIYGPAFARCAARQDQQGLRVLLRRSQLICSAVFIPTALALIALAGPLSALFGEEFGELQALLCILAAGQLINAVTGLCGVLLNMAGAASRELAALVLALVIALAGSLLVGPHAGATGLALLFSGSIALKNLVSYFMARRIIAVSRVQP